MGTRKKVDRRDFTKATLAAGAAGVVLSNVVGAAVASSAVPTTQAAPGPATPPKKGATGWREGTTIPAEYYLDPGHYQRDERFIADTLWLMVDHESRIANPGDYFVFEFGRAENVIIVRNGDGA